MQVRKPKYIFDIQQTETLTSMQIFAIMISVFGPCAEIFICKLCAYLLKSEEGQVFLEQERQHSKNHIKLNQALENAKISTSLMERIALRSLLIVTKYLPDKVNITLAYLLENMTYYLSTLFLNGDLGEIRLGSSVDEFFRWHAYEEIEHGHILPQLYRSYNISLIYKMIAFGVFSSWAVLMAGYGIYLGFKKRSIINSYKAILILINKKTLKMLVDSLRR